MPVVTAYSVLVHRVLNIRVLVRSAIEYGLARGAVFLIGLSPLLLVAVYAFSRRGERLEALFSGYGPIFIAVAIVGVLLYVEGPRLRTEQRRSSVPQRRDQAT